MFIQGWYSFFIQRLAVRLGKQEITDAFYSQVMENINKFVLHTAMNKGRKRLIICIIRVSYALFSFSKMISLLITVKWYNLEISYFDISFSLVQWSKAIFKFWYCMINILHWFIYIFLLCRQRSWIPKRKFLNYLGALNTSFCTCLSTFRDVVLKKAAVKANAVEWKWKK